MTYILQAFTPHRTLHAYIQISNVLFFMCQISNNFLELSLFNLLVFLFIIETFSPELVRL